MKVTNKTDTN